MSFDGASWSARPENELGSYISGQRHSDVPESSPKTPTLDGHEDCSRCDDCILPPGLQPAAFRNRRSPPQEHSGRPTSLAIGLSYLTSRLNQITSLDKDQIGKKADLLARLKDHASAMEMLGLPRMKDETVLNGRQILDHIQSPVDALATERKQLVLWDRNMSPIRANARHGRTIKAIQQLLFGALRMLDVGGVLHVRMAPQSKGGVTLEMTASSFTLPTNWDRSHPGPNACPLPIGTLGAFRLALDLVSKPSSALGVRHYPSQSVLQVDLADAI